MAHGRINFIGECDRQTNNISRFHASSSTEIRKRERINTISREIIKRKEKTGKPENEIENEQRNEDQGRNSRGGGKGEGKGAQQKPVVKEPPKLLAKN